MKKLAFAAMLIGATGLLACGGDDDDNGVTFPDSGPGGDSGPAQVCNPVAQTGCEAGEKCTWLVVSEEPFLGRVDCVPDGTVEIGGACTRAMPGEDSTVDDCRAGGLCVSGTCREICSINPDSCGEGFACALYENTFSDESTGVCDPTCNPVTQDCQLEGQGCYLSFADGVATCAGVPEPAVDAMQNDPCHSPNGGMNCYLNGCAEGYGPAVFQPEGPALCTAYCSPVNTYLVDPQGTGEGDLAPGSDADGADLADCSAGRIGVSGHQCRFFQGLLNQDGAFYDYISEEYGFCADSALAGDCSQFSLEYILAIFDGLVEADGDPMTTGPDDLQGFCEQQPDRCAQFTGCTDAATTVAIIDAYCTTGPGADVQGGFCSSSARRAEFRRMSLDLIKKRYEAAGLPVPPMLLAE